VGAALAFLACDAGSSSKRWNTIFHLSTLSIGI
jgi:hypothetical protein